jgi:hypothetical protein
MYNGREKGAAHQEEELSSRLEERDAAFQQDDRRDKRVGDWRAFQKDSDPIGAAVKKPKNSLY